MREKNITLHERRDAALRKQNMLNDPYEFPFTLNPNIGCLFACSYCYTQKDARRWQMRWGVDVKVKTWLPNKLDRELVKYHDLPQHLKRVQVGNACECYDPTVITRTRRETGRDLIGEIYGVFRRHWNDGNQWMVHVITKSHMILRHLDILSEMLDQVQVEITLTCLDEHIRRRTERYAPSVEKRLGVIETLAGAGVFVRVMAMPVDTREEVIDISRVTFDRGARAIKHKGLNYFEERDVLTGQVRKRKRRNDLIFTDLMVESGEPVDGERRTAIMPVDRNKWRQLEPREMPVLRSGYSDLNDIDWGYLV